MAASIEIGVAPEGPQSLALKRANRHGLIAGATGTGKTVTLQVLAEEFAREGVNVFAADIKGDLSGIARRGEPPPAWADARADEIGMPLTPEAQPVVFWDVYGELGHPVRTTVTEMGPVLMGRVLEATDAQEGALTVAFRLADDWLKQGKNEGLLLDLDDLRALLTYISDNADDIGKKYGLVTPQRSRRCSANCCSWRWTAPSASSASRRFKLEDLMRPRADGRGTVNVLASERLVQSPRLYSAFLLWLMSELWEELPEVGDLDKPKLVFFFDEAHLLFRDAPKELINKVEQVVRLIRSKGVGIYFVTQSPTDIPEIVLAQLGNRYPARAARLHAGRSEGGARGAASFRANPKRRRGEGNSGAGRRRSVGLDARRKGAPTPVARTKMRPPNSQVGPLLLATRQQMIAACDLGPPTSRRSTARAPSKNWASAPRPRRTLKPNGGAKPRPPRRRPRATPSAPAPRAHARRRGDARGRS